MEKMFNSDYFQRKTEQIASPAFSRARWT